MARAGTCNRGGAGRSRRWRESLARGLVGGVVGDGESDVACDLGDGSADQFEVADCELCVVGDRGVSLEAALGLIEERCRSRVGRGVVVGALRAAATVSRDWWRAVPARSRSSLVALSSGVARSMSATRLRPARSSVRRRRDMNRAASLCPRSQTATAWRSVSVRRASCPSPGCLTWR